MIMGTPPPGKRWDWDTAKGAWALVDDPSATPAPSPVVRPAADPFHMPARRNAPLDAQRPAVVAAGEAVRRMR